MRRYRQPRPDDSGGILADLLLGFITFLILFAIVLVAQTTVALTDQAAAEAKLETRAIDLVFVIDTSASWEESQSQVHETIRLIGSLLPKVTVHGVVLR